MDGVHDLGGMQGFGRLPIHDNEPAFHHDWEGRVFAMRILTGFWGAWNTDSGRHSVECLPPTDYLSMTYFEKWLASLVNLSVAGELVTRDEVAAGRAAPGTEPLVGAADAAVVRKVWPNGSPTHRELDVAPAFAVGDRVRTEAYMHDGHTRLPRYARGRVGEIVDHHGPHVFPDRHAAGAGEDPRHLYTVSFTARELWGDDARTGDTVCLDLWEPYLAPAE